MTASFFQAVDTKTTRLNQKQSVASLSISFFIVFDFTEGSVNMRRVLKCALAYDPSLTVLRWPCVADKWRDIKIQLLTSLFNCCLCVIFATGFILFCWTSFQCNPSLGVCMCVHVCARAVTQSKSRCVRTNKNHIPDMTCVATSEAGAADGLDVDFNSDSFSRPCSNSCVFFIMKNKSIKEMNSNCTITRTFIHQWH